MERHVYWQQTIDGSLDDVVDIVRTRASEVLGPHVDPVSDEPIHRLHAHFGGSELSKRVEILHEAPEEFAKNTWRIRVKWHATDHVEFFPVMVGELEFIGLSVHPPRCEIAFIGHYRPPGGVAGAIADHIVGHRIADEAVAGLVRDVCNRIDHAIKMRSEATATV